jgi:hypothetical protein
MAQGSVGAAAWRVAAAAEAATLAAATVVEVGCANSTHARAFTFYTWSNAVHAGGFQGRGGGRGGGDSFASRGGGDRGRGRGGH